MEGRGVLKALRALRALRTSRTMRGPTQTFNTNKDIQSRNHTQTPSSTTIHYNHVLQTYIKPLHSSTLQTILSISSKRSLSSFPLLPPLHFTFSRSSLTTSPSLLSIPPPPPIWSNLCPQLHPIKTSITPKSNNTRMATCIDTQRSRSDLG